mgnify:CR=1 FL=1
MCQLWYNPKFCFYKQIELHRRDGLETTVMELDRSFHMIMSAEMDNTIHSLHRPHRCEDKFRLPVTIAQGP